MKKLWLLVLLSLLWSSPMRAFAQNEVSCREAMRGLFDTDHEIVGAGTLHAKLDKGSSIIYLFTNVLERASSWNPGIRTIDIFRLHPSGNKLAGDIKLIQVHHADGSPHETGRRFEMDETGAISWRSLPVSPTSAPIRWQSVRCYRAVPIVRTDADGNRLYSERFVITAYDPGYRGFVTIDLYHDPSL